MLANPLTELRFEVAGEDRPTKTWLTSDSHFGHANIIEYANRPFKDVYEMDNALINAWNSVVWENDEVYFLGDFCLGSSEMADNYFSQLNGSRIWVLANPRHHDKRWIPYRGQILYNDTHPQYRTRNGGFVHILPSIHVLELKQYQKDGYCKALVMCHYEMAVWDRKHYLSWHAYGHSHSTGYRNELKLDVGVDNAKFILGEYRPFALEEFSEIMLEKEAKIDPEKYLGE